MSVSTIVNGLGPELDSLLEKTDITPETIVIQVGWGTISTFIVVEMSLLSIGIGRIIDSTPQHTRK